MSTDPAAPQPRVIVVCFDGTTNQYTAQNTNVVKFYGLLDKTCPLQQIVYYQPGIGTYINPGVVSPALTWIAKILDEAFAWFLSEHVMGGYKFLMENYRSGDKICIFGFSRGAYTARALAGFLYKIGLLPRDNVEQVPFAYNLYKRTDNAGLKIAEGFKKTFCAPVTIDFLGVWDTVASVGLLYSPTLPFTSVNSAVRVFRHALALDEHRARFQPNAFHRESPQDAARRREDPTLPVQSESQESEHGARWGITVHRYSGEHQSQIPGTNRQVPSKSGGPPEPSSMVLLSSNPIPPVLEVWFVGCHSDVGGGAVPDSVRYSVADIPLRWMVKQVILSQCGIRFDDAALRSAGIDIATVVPIAPTRVTENNVLEAEVGDVTETTTGPQSVSDEGGSTEHLLRRRRPVRDATAEDYLEAHDVLADIHDELKLNPIWWILEFFPTTFMWQDPDGTWRSRLGLNFGRSRQIRDPQPLLHDSVRQRMAIPELKYKPKAKFIPGTEQYIN